jgi:hypothetical protein
VSSIYLLFILVFDDYDVKTTRLLVQELKKDLGEVHGKK